LLLFAIGSWNPRAIKTQKRLAGYTANDFELLSNFLNQFASIATTAHILTEVSNLAGAASGQMKEAIFLQLESLFVILDERQRSAISLCAVPEFRIFGITDAAISSLGSEMLLLTEDGRLARHLQLKGMNAWTLEHLRALREQANNA
jgi:hypothetical protein